MRRLLLDRYTLLGAGGMLALLFVIWLVSLAILQTSSSPSIMPPPEPVRVAAPVELPAEPLAAPMPPIAAEPEKPVERSAPRRQLARRNSNDTPFPAGGLATFFRDNQVAAEDQLKGEVLEVRGTVERVGKELAGGAYLVLRGFDRNSLLNVRCGFTRAEDLRDVRPGEERTVQGTCRGYLLGSVLLADCDFMTNEQIIAARPVDPVFEAARQKEVARQKAVREKEQAEDRQKQVKEREKDEALQRARLKAAAREIEEQRSLDRAAELARLDEKAAPHLRFARKLAGSKDKADRAKAVERLREIVKDYPATDAARQAGTLLDALQDKAGK